MVRNILGIILFKAFCYYLSLNTNKYLNIITSKNLSRDLLEKYQIECLKNYIDLQKNNFTNLFKRLDAKEIRSYSGLLKYLSLQKYSNKISIKNAVDSLYNRNCRLKKNKIIRETTGTTGIPISIYLDHENSSFQLMVRKYCFSWYSINIGVKEARFWGTKENTFKYRFKNFILNRKIFNFFEDNSLNNAKRLINYNPLYFYGYSSLIFEAARIFEKYKLTLPSLKAIFCTGETLFDYQKQYIEKVFNCSVAREYGCSEVDIIAFECKKGKYHIVNPNIVLEDSTEGCVITDLGNFSMPIFRYVLGDKLIIGLNSCSCGNQSPVIEKIEGRSISQKVILPNGKYLHAVVFAHIIEDLNRNIAPIIRFRVYQKSKLLFLFIIELEQIHENGIKNEIRKYIKSIVRERIHPKVIVNIHFKRIMPEPGRKYDYYISEIND